MEKKKNNALEKAQKAQVNNKEVNKYKAKKTTSQTPNIDKNEQKEKLTQEKKLSKDKNMAEKQKAKAQKRLELARLKAHKKAEKEKQKATRLREKNRRKMELKEKKEQLKKERLEKKQMLKNESKKERQKRIRLEKMAKKEQREKKQKQKAEKRAQILADKKAKREAKAQERKEKREIRQRNKEKNKNFGGWLAAVISLGVATLVLASVLTVTLLTPTMNDNVLESSYQRAFYDAVEQVDNIDVNLSKILASKDTSAVQKYLVNTAINSELAEKDIQELPIKDESKFYTAKLVNQIGDYSKYLNNKIIDGQELTSQDKEGLRQLYEANLSLKNALQEMMNSMDGKYSFTNIEKTKNDDIVLKRFNELQNLSVQYPELIYDGPFSDGITNREIKGLSNQQVSFDEAKENFAKIFKDYSFSQIISAGEINGDIECYNIIGKNSEQTLYAQISKKGGKLIMFDMAGQCNSTIVEQQTAIENALAFLDNLDLEQLKEVWLNLSNNVYTINFAGQSNGIILYPDLVKVRVCAQTGKVIGLEAKSYYTNHTQRNLQTPVLTRSQAQAKLFDEMDVESCRLAVIPFGQKSEKLCYEFSGEANGQTYYIYIDAVNGKQVQMFKVVESSEGTLLM